MINFEKYDNENPEIYAVFKKAAFKAKERGRQRFSARDLFGVIRWLTPVRGNDNYKINNIYTADYARKLMNEYPEFKGFFQIKELKAQRNGH